MALGLDGLLGELEQLDVDELRDLEPFELARLCRDPVFRALCAYCGVQRSRAAALFMRDDDDASCF